jgi:hypothetical protein
MVDGNRVKSEFRLRAPGIRTSGFRRQASGSFSTGAASRPGRFKRKYPKPEAHANSYGLLRM